MRDQLDCLQPTIAKMNTSDQELEEAAQAVPFLLSPQD
jgi:hypothetical protein